MEQPQLKIQLHLHPAMQRGVHLPLLNASLIDLRGAAGLRRSVMGY